MKEKPAFPKNRSGTASTTVLMILLLFALTLSAGCESEEAGASAVPAVTTLPAPVKTIINPPVTTPVPPTGTTTEPEPVPEETTKEPADAPAATPAVSGNYHQEYIRMDSTSYSVGEVVQFYLVNKGPEINGCEYAHPPYTIYHLSPAGIRLPVATGDTSRSYMTVISDPNSATGPFSLDTSRLSAGRYLIRFDCGNNVAREFVIMSRVQVIET